MMAIVARLLAFLAPFLIFLALVAMLRRIDRKGGFADPRTANRLVALLFVIALAVTGTIIWVAMNREPQDPRALRYVPPHFEEGRVVPDRLAPKREEPRRAPTDEPERKDDGSPPRP